MLTAASPKGAVRASEVSGEDLVQLLDPSINAVEDARRRVVDHLAPLALPPRALNRLEVVLEELITNVLRHGFDTARGHALLLTIGPRPTAVELVIEDNGRPFNPVEAPEPAPFTTVGDARLGGLGIRAVRRSSTVFRYAAAPDSSNWRRLADQGDRPVNRVLVRISTEG